jgi:hypothetical protein
MTTTKCRHCTTQIQLPSWEPHDAPRPICQRCRELLAELGDTTVPAPVRAREPGSDDVKPKTRTGKWLMWAARKRGRLHDVHHFGREHGFPRRVEDWSARMIQVCVEALVASKAPRK